MSSFKKLAMAGLLLPMLIVVLGCGGTSLSTMPLGTLSIRVPANTDPSVQQMPDNVQVSPAIGEKVNAALQVDGGQAPYRWLVASGSLPSGMSLSQNGVLSGVASTTGTWNSTVAVQDSAAHTATQAMRIAVTSTSSLAITTTTLPSATMGAVYTTSLAATGGKTPYTWFGISGSLPAGVSLTSAGVLSGTPTQSGSFTFTVALVDSSSPAQTRTQTLTLTVVSPLSIGTTALASGTSGTAYSASLAASGGTPAYTWSVVSGALPTGLSLSTAGVLSGTPTAAGTFSFTAQVADAGGQRQTVTLSVTITGAPLAITTSTLPSAQAGSAYSATLVATGGKAPYLWFAISGSMPTGMSFSTAGVLSGTPQQAGSFTFTAAVTDSSTTTQSKTQTLTLTVAPLPLAISTASLSNGTSGTAYSAILSATGGTPSYIWSVASGSLPAGLTLSTAGVVSGTPTTPGTSTVTVAVTDASSTVQRQTKTYAITVAAGTLAISSSTLTSGQVGTAYTATLTASGGTPNFTWFPIAGSISSGLSISQAGVISGTPTQAGTYTFTVAVVDSGLPVQTKTQSLTLTVNSSALAISTAGLSTGQNGVAYAAALQASGGVAGYTFSVKSGKLPTGLILAGTTGIISGTPTVAGSFTFVAVVADSSTLTQTAAVSATITITDVSTNSLAAGGTTWYVRPDGGTRYSTSMPLGQCDGKSDAAYPGAGTNQHCAFNQAVYLWSDGSYASGYSFPAWGWIGSGGDTYVLRGAISDGVSYRLGWNNNYNTYDATTGHYWGLAGDPYNSGMPVPLAGTVARPTRILGGNYGACTTAGAKTQLHGGYGVYQVMNLAGASNVEVQCIDMTDFSSCSKSSSTNSCSRNIPLSDYASAGITLNNTTTNVLIQDVAVHGMAADGVRGPTGDGVVMRRISIKGNPSSGWNADDGTVGSGSLLVQNFDISWNGCSEEYPIVDSLPYQGCTDDNSGGYGDGFGTASIVGSTPWKVTFDTGTVSYNTQDGLDALHLQGTGSSMTVNRVLAFGNMGQQLKVGGATGSITNSLITTNCTALRETIPGTPAGYNTLLTDFCRAANTGVLMTVGKGARSIFDSNTIYSNAATSFEVECDTTAGACDTTALMEYRDNVFLGFLSSSGDYSNPIYVGASPNPFTNAGSTFDHNLTWHAKSNWSCANTRLNEVNATCGDPGLTDESWHAYGYGNMTPTASSIVKGSGAAITTVTTDYTGATRSTTPSIGAYE